MLSKHRVVRNGVHVRVFFQTKSGSRQKVAGKHDANCRRCRNASLKSEQRSWAIPLNFFESVPRTLGYSFEKKKREKRKEEWSEPRLSLPRERRENNTSLKSGWPVNDTGKVVRFTCGNTLHTVTMKLPSFEITPDRHTHARTHMYTCTG